jgi:type II secretory pathway pseudopilin PulG
MHHSIMKKSTRSAFTLVELMIIVAILGDILIIALPAFIRSRNMAQNTKFVGDLRTCSGAFEMYAAENNKYPNPTTAGVIPSGMSIYLRGFPWESTNSIGGAWLWTPGYENCTAAIEIDFPSAMDDIRMADIDSRFDNGILATGSFRQVDATHYYYIVEQ